jgi:hypothetical protein
LKLLVRNNMEFGIILFLVMALALVVFEGYKSLRK